LKTGFFDFGTERCAFFFLDRRKKNSRVKLEGEKKKKAKSRKGRIGG